MSRSNPVDSLQNPSTKWIEWNGGTGILEYYDKAAEKKVTIDGKFTFILLDQLSTVKGWHNASESGIYANEVRNTSTDILSVKSFKGGDIVSGLYKEIREKVSASGGKFTANLYVAIKSGEKLEIAAVQLSGAALNAWIDFVKENKSSIYTKAVQVVGSEDGKKGTIVFKTPIFQLNEISEVTNLQAVESDKVLQDYLSKKLVAKVSDTEDVQTADAQDTADHVVNIDDLPF